MPLMTRQMACCLALGAVLGLAGCARTAPTATAPAPVAAASANSGMIVAIRKLAPDAPGSASNPRSTILAALGTGAISTQSPVPGMEFVVRLDDGQTLSVVQPNDQNLRPGDRVTLARSPRTRILRAS